MGKESTAAWWILLGYAVGLDTESPAHVVQPGVSQTVKSQNDFWPFSRASHLGVFMALQ